MRVCQLIDLTWEGLNGRMPAMPFVRCIIVSLLISLTTVGCYPPQIQYANTNLVTSRRSTLQQNLLQLLPENERNLPAAKAEAKWLADTAYKAAAGISRVNGSNFPGWAGNVLVNARLQDRGLCWHYQHDMYRELRRRSLTYFRIGCCVRDKKKRTEHNCVYIAAAKGRWPQVWMLDAWMWNGRLKVAYGPELNPKRWQDLPAITRVLSEFYFEAHEYPVEHWYMLRGTGGRYVSVINNKEPVDNLPQFRRMIEAINKGYREHPGSPTNY